MSFNRVQRIFQWQCWICNRVRVIFFVAHYGQFGKHIAQHPILNNVRAGPRAADLKVIGNIQSFLLTNPQISADKIFLLYVSTPKLLAPGPVNMSVTAADDNSRNSFYSLSNILDPTGPTQGTISPTQVLLSDLVQRSIRFDIFLRSFQLIYSSIDVIAMLLSADGFEKSTVPSVYVSITSSSSAGTFLRLTLPSCPNEIFQLEFTGGNLKIQVYPSSLPVNMASFTISILDQIDAQDPSPSTVYTTGNDLIEVILLKFYVKTAQPSDSE